MALNLFRGVCGDPCKYQIWGYRTSFPPWEKRLQFSAEAMKSNMEVGENIKNKVKITMKIIAHRGLSPILNEVNLS